MRSKYLVLSAVFVLAGIILSGPVGSAFVQIISPQPDWVNVGTYIKNYSVLQTAPFYFGYLLMFGFILFIASLPKPQTDKQRIYDRLAVLFTGVYCFMIGLNYLVQIVLVPLMLDDTRAIELLATLNARSVFWYVEMTGYGFLGLATWAGAPLFRGGGKRTAIRMLCVANGVLSVAGAVLTYVFKGWVLTMPGLMCYLAWNLLVVILMICVIAEYKKQETA